MSTMVMIAMTVVTMVIVAATIAVCKTTEEAIAVTISVSSVSSSVSSVVMIAGVVMTTMIPSMSSNVEVTHIVPGGEERSKLGLACNPLLYFILRFSKYFFQQIPLETSVVHILEIPWIPLMMNIARIAEPSQVCMLLALPLLRN